jgi:CheY-like chemotaxis protein
MKPSKIHLILLVDDDPITNFINKKLLENLQVTEKIHICLNGKEAIDFLIQLKELNDPPPNLILLDTNMPVMDGFEFLNAYEELYFSRESKTIIFILTVSTEGDIEKIKSLGYEIIEKPLTEEKMHQILEFNCAEKK